MNKFLKNLLAIALLGLATSASATCVQNCEVYNTTTPPPQTTQNLSFEIGGGAAFSGFGGSMFEGQYGKAEVNKNGYGFTETTLNAGGSLCGINCQDGSFEFKGQAGEAVTALGAASSYQSGLAATATNQGLAASAVKFNFKKLTE
jgi:hypothetical protein